MQPNLLIPVHQCQLVLCLPTFQASRPQQLLAGKTRLVRYKSTWGRSSDKGCIWQLWIWSSRMGHPSLQGPPRRSGTSWTRKKTKLRLLCWARARRLSMEMRKICLRASQMRWPWDFTPTEIDTFLLYLKVGIYRVSGMHGINRQLKYDAQSKQLKFGHQKHSVHFSIAWIFIACHVFTKDESLQFEPKTETTNGWMISDPVISAKWH